MCIRFVFVLKVIPFKVPGTCMHSYGKCSNISDTFLFLFFDKMLVIRAGIHKMHVKRSDCFLRSSLIWVCTVCIGLFGWQPVFEILEHLLYSFISHTPILKCQLYLHFHFSTTAVFLSIFSLCVYNIKLLTNISQFFTCSAMYNIITLEYN